MVVIEESGMKFGEYPEEDVFHIEASPQYRKKLMSQGVKSCEFILSRNKVLYFIEAKTGSPKETTEDSPEEKKEKYTHYISEITGKMKHAVSLYANILLRRYGPEGVPADLLRNDPSDKEIRLILVVKNAKKEWLVPLQDKLRSEMNTFCSIWKIKGLFVINESTAREKHFVI